MSPRGGSRSGGYRLWRTLDGVTGDWKIAPWDSHRRRRAEGEAGCTYGGRKEADTEKGIWYKGMIRKAVIPVAGLGTRVLLAMKAQPKEMLPVIDKSVQWVIYGRSDCIGDKR